MKQSSNGLLIRDLKVQALDQSFITELEQTMEFNTRNTDEAVVLTEDQIDYELTAVYFEY